MHLAFSLHHQTHRTYQRLLARKIYKYTFEFYHAKLLILHAREKYAMPSQSHKNIYDCLYIYRFGSEQQCIFAINPTPWLFPFTAHWLSFQSSFGAQKHWIPFAGNLPRSSAQCTWNALQWGCYKSKPTSGPLGSFWAARMMRRANPRDQVKGSLKFKSL